MQFIIITNNPLVDTKFNALHPVNFDPDASFLDILLLVRSKIHIGHKLLTHPLMGSIKPKETPYKSLVISNNSLELDYKSLQLIEDAIIITDNFTEERGWPKEILDDFKLIDFDLITSGIESITQYN